MSIPPQSAPVVAAVHEGNGVHLAADLDEVIWGSIAFVVVLAFLLWRLAPLAAAALRGRTARIEAELGGTRDERNAAEEVLVARSARLADRTDETDRILAEAETRATVLRAELVARAEAEARAILERGRLEMAGLRRQAQADARDRMIRVTKATTETAVRDGLDPVSHRRLIDDYIDQVARLP